MSSQHERGRDEDFERCYRLEAEELKRGRIRDATSNRGKVGVVTDRRQTQERASDNRSELLAVYQHFL